MRRRGIPSCIGAGGQQTRDCFIARSDDEGASPSAGRRDGHLLTLCIHVGRFRAKDQSYPSHRGRTVIVMRGTYLYRKCVLFHRPRQRVQRTRCPCVPLPLFYIFFTFEIAETRQRTRRRGGEGESGERERSQKHYKTQFPGAAAGAIFRASERTTDRVTERGRANRGEGGGSSMRFSSTSIGRTMVQRGRIPLVSAAQNGFRR